MSNWIMFVCSDRVPEVDRKHRTNLVDLGDGLGATVNKLLEMNLTLESK